MRWRRWLGPGGPEWLAEGEAADLVFETSIPTRPTPPFAML